MHRIKHLNNIIFYKLIWRCIRCRHWNDHELINWKFNLNISTIPFLLPDAVEQKNDFEILCSKALVMLLKLINNLESIPGREKFIIRIPFVAVEKTLFYCRTRSFDGWMDPCTNKNPETTTRNIRNPLRLRLLQKRSRTSRTCLRVLILVRKCVIVISAKCR